MGTHDVCLGHITSDLGSSAVTDWASGQLRASHVTDAVFVCCIAPYCDSV